MNTTSVPNSLTSSTNSDFNSSSNQSKSSSSLPSFDFLSSLMLLTITGYAVFMFKRKKK